MSSVPTIIHLVTERGIMSINITESALYCQYRFTVSAVLCLAVRILIINLLMKTN